MDDEPVVIRALERMLTVRGYTVDSFATADDLETLVARAPDAPWDAILLDVNIGPTNGLELLSRLQAVGNRAAVIMLTGDDSAATATAALKGGAFHYVVKPPRVDAFLDLVGLAALQTALRRELTRVSAVPPGEAGTLAGHSPAMTELRRKLPPIAAANVSVLVVGESGTGKEVLARAIHRASPRAARPFVPLNCGAIPEGLIDSELFGHTRGAFTGAVAARAGVFVEADGGTLFLDEIGDMPMPVQARLLRALQEHEVRAVGGEGVRAVDVRVIAATNVDLERAVQAGRFRADLYFRLNVVNLHLPPLRQRLDDLPELVAVLLGRHVDPSTEPPRVEGDALAAMLAYAWPGNIRELENALRHALAMSDGGPITIDALPAAVSSSLRRLAQGSSPIAPIPVAPSPDETLTEAKRRAAAQFERSYLLRVLEQAKGSISTAARMAGVDRTNFRRLLQRHGIDVSRFRS